MKTKVCKKCRKELPMTREYFTIAKGNKDGFSDC